jgi:CubicO group peptidase (beta-lactamase class C family)
MTGADPQSFPNPALCVGADNKQGWNQPAARRHGFHNAHLLFRRTMMFRARRVLTLTDARSAAIDAAVIATGVTANPAFSALVVAEGNSLLHQSHAADFAADRPHSIQSITKMHIHLIVGELIAAGRLDLDRRVESYLPRIGSGYARARIGDLLDMNLRNDFSEDYADPFADCYREEQALGWRLPPDGAPELSLQDFAASLTGGDLTNLTGYADYKSANTDVLTLIAAGLTDLPARIAAITDAAGYEGGFHISLSVDGVPGFSGGGCLSARDLARFGLLIARGGRGVCAAGSEAGGVGSATFTAQSLRRSAPLLSPARSWQRYSNHLMTDGTRLGHAGYGGQYLMVDMETGRAAAFLSVLENPSGYDEGYMHDVVRALEQILAA